MKNWKSCIITPDATIKQAAEKIDKSGLQIALVVNEENKLIGTITDGDIRRGLLKGFAFDNNVKSIMKESPIKSHPGESASGRKALMKQHLIQKLPLVDDNNVLVGLDSYDSMETQGKFKDNWVVLMAGGQGKRLHPLTQEVPKPLLEVGGQPILKRIIDSFISYGFNKFFISVNYKAEMIEQYFKDGGDLGVEIEYLRESENLGTAGSLGLLQEAPDIPLIVMNGDILTKVNFDHLLEFHAKSDAFCTVCVRKYDFQVPYGVVELSDGQIDRIVEKPFHNFFVSSGVYVLNPTALKSISGSSYLDMPTLVGEFIGNKEKVCAFPIREYWLDIGQMDDFKKANWEISTIFEE